MHPPRLCHGHQEPPPVTDEVGHCWHERLAQTRSHEHPQGAEPHAESWILQTPTSTQVKGVLCLLHKSNICMEVGQLGINGSVL